MKRQTPMPLKVVVSLLQLSTLVSLSRFPHVHSFCTTFPMILAPFHTYSYMHRERSLSLTVWNRKLRWFPSELRQHMTRIGMRRRNSTDVDGKVCDRDSTNTTTADVYGTGRGVVLQAAVLLFCVWLFSVPPEFRRAHFCFGVETCLTNRAKCYD